MHFQTYNLTDYLEDTPHIIRHISSLTLSSLLLILATALFPLLLLRSKRPPLKAHGIAFQILKYLGYAYGMVYFSVFPMMNRMLISMYVCFIGLFFVYPTLLRTWTIYNILVMTKLKLSVASGTHEGSQEQVQKSIRRRTYFISRGFLITVSVALFLAHLMLTLPAIPLYFPLPSDFYTLMWGLFVVVVTCILYGAMLIVLYVKLKRLGVRENYQIVSGITANGVDLFIAGCIAAVYLIMHLVLGLVDYNTTGRSLYYVFAPLDLFFIAMGSWDYFYSTTVPLVSTFLWKNNDQGEIKDTNKLHQVFSDKAAKTMFKNFAASEFSIENIVFTDKLNQLNSTSTSLNEQKLVQQYAQLFSEFVEVGSVFQLNINLDRVVNVKKALQSSDMKLINQEFERLRLDVEINMQDTLSRFKQTKEYRNWETCVKLGQVTEVWTEQSEWVK